MNISEAANVYLQHKVREGRKSRYLEITCYALSVFVNTVTVTCTTELEPRYAAEALGNVRRGDGRRYAEATKGSFVRVWKLFFDWLKEEGLTRYDLRRALPFIETVAPRIVVPKAAEVKQLISSLDEFSTVSASSLRDAMCVRLVYDSGMRLIELHRLELAVVKASLARVESNGMHCIVTLGKGDKEVVHYYTPTAAIFVRRWLEVRPDIDLPYLLVTPKGHIGASTVKTAFAKAADFAGVPRYYSHAWRRLFISDLNREGVDLPTVQQAANHADSRTTLKHYIAIDREHVENEIGRVALERQRFDGDDLAGDFFAAAS